MINELGRYVTNNLSGLIQGTNFFIGHAPTELTDAHSTLMESGGVADYYLPDKREYRFQVMTRAQNYQDARATAHLIHDFLHKKTAVQLPVLVSDELYLVNIIQSIHTPQYLGVDQRGLQLISTNYVVKLQDP